MKMEIHKNKHAGARECPLDPETEVIATGEEDVKARQGDATEESATAARQQRAGTEDAGESD